MESPRLRNVAFVALLMSLMGLGLVSPAFAQGAGASIDGIVKDQQGGVLPGVTVTLRNVDSGVTRTSTTEADGRYRFLALPPARYHLSAELSGFAAKDVGDVSMTIGLLVTKDFTMGIQALEESVTVTGAAPVTVTDSSRVWMPMVKSFVTRSPIVIETSPTSFGANPDNSAERWYRAGGSARKR